MLKTKKFATNADLQKITARVEAELEVDLEFALNSPLPDKSIAYENVYAAKA